MVEAFTGTQAELADELERLAKSLFAEPVNPELNANSRWWRSFGMREASALVRNAIITEEPTP